MADEELSLREEIVNAFKESETTEAESGAPSGDTGLADNEQPTQPEPVAADASDEGKRDGPTVAKDGAGADKKEKESTDGIKPPDRFTAEQKEEFATLDPAVQRILSTRNRELESSYTKRMMEIAQERQRFSGIEEALAPHRQSWAGTGWDDATALQNIMGYWQHASQDPMGFIARFAQERGIDLASQFAPSADEIMQYLNSQQQFDEDGNPVPMGQAPGIHPDIQRRLETYEQRIAQTDQRYAQMQQYVNHMISQQQTAAQSAAQQELSSFINETDESGNLKHEHYEELKPSMIQLMEAGMASSLTEAYDKALWASPQTRNKVLETQQVMQRRESERRAQEEAQRAREASMSVTSSGVPGTPQPEREDDGSIRSILNAEFRRASQRASGMI